MLYLSQMIGEPVVDAQGERLGTISDLAISTGEVFPRITSLAFQGPGRVPFMISWRKYVDTFDDDGITLSVDAHDIRFSYLQTRCCWPATLWTARSSTPRALRSCA